LEMPECQFPLSKAPFSFISPHIAFALWSPSLSRIEKQGNVDIVTPCVSLAAIANVTGRPPLAAVLQISQPNY
jgi:hypothetical protein